MDAFRDRGVAVAALVIDPPATNATLARDAGLTFPILADPQRTVIDPLGLRHAGGGPEDSDIAHPATLLVDAAGVVRWRRVAPNVRTRPSPDEILAAVDRLVLAAAPVDKATPAP